MKTGLLIKSRHSALYIDSKRGVSNKFSRSTASGRRSLQSSIHSIEKANDSEAPLVKEKNFEANILNQM